MAKIELQYDLDSGLPDTEVTRNNGLENIVKLSNNLLAFKEHVEKNHRYVYFDVCLDSQDPTYHVTLEANVDDDGGYLYRAVGELIEKCGMPNHVSQDYNRVVNSILLKYGKKINNGFSRFLVGTTVVPV